MLTSTVLGIRRVANMWKPFNVDVQPFIDEITKKEKMIRECADVATMERVRSMCFILHNPLRME